MHVDMKIEFLLPIVTRLNFSLHTSITYSFFPFTQFVWFNLGKEDADRKELKIIRAILQTKLILMVHSEKKRNAPIHLL